MAFKQYLQKEILKLLEVRNKFTKFRSSVMEFSFRVVSPEVMGSVFLRDWRFGTPGIYPSIFGGHLWI